MGTGRFEGKELTTLYTIQIRPRGTSEDIRDGAGILYMAGSSRATYWMTGSLKSTREWRELVRRTMAFGGDCTGELRELKGVMTSDETLVNSKGKSRTKVWK